MVHACHTHTKNRSDQCICCIATFLEQTYTDLTADAVFAGNGTKVVWSVLRSFMVLAGDSLPVHKLKILKR